MNKVVQGERLLVEFLGPLDGEHELPSITEIGLKEVILTLENVTHLNSRGIRTLMNWFQELNQSYPMLRLYLDRVPILMAKQIMSIGGLIPDTSRILSLQIPFYCESCDQEDLVWAATDAEVTTAEKSCSLALMKHKCSSCGSDSELDLIPKAFFGALAKYGVR